MEGESYVTKDMCEVINSNVKDDIREIKDSVLSTNEGLKELAIISGKLTTLQELQAKSLDTMNSRVTVVEDTQAKSLGVLEVRVTAIEDKLKSKSDKKRFIETKTFELLVKAGVVILIMLVMAAIGQNYLDDIKPMLGK